MIMQGKDIVKLAAEFAAGGISADAIRERYGDGIMSSVLAVAGGVGAGYIAGKALDVLDEHTGIVSDVGSVVDDILDLF